MIRDFIFVTGRSIGLQTCLCAQVHLMQLVSGSVYKRGDLQTHSNTAYASSLLCNIHHVVQYFQQDFRDEEFEEWALLKVLRAVDTRLATDAMHKTDTFSPVSVPQQAPVDLVPGTGARWIRPFT